MIRMALRLMLQGIRDLRLNLCAQLLTLTAVTLTAFLSGLFLMALTTMNHQLGTVRGETIFQIYWDAKTPLESLRAQWLELQRMPGFARLQSFTPAEALDNMGKKLGYGAKSFPETFPFLAADNPLPPTALVAFAPQDENFDAWFEATLRRLNALPQARRVAATPLRDELGHAWRMASRYIMWPSIAFLSLVLALVVGNTIRLSLLTKQSEVEILRLIGAFAWYIRLPLVTGGAVQGALGGACALVLLQLLHSRIHDALNFPPLLLEITFIPWEMRVLLVLVPMCMGILGSWVAVRA